MRLCRWLFLFLLCLPQPVRAADLLIFDGFEAGAPDPGWGDMGTVAFGSVGASYGAALTDSHNKLEILVDNQTDAAIYVSFNGTNNHEILAAGQAAKWDFGSYGRYESGNVSIKHTGAAPTSGNVYVSARY